MAVMRRIRPTARSKALPAPVGGWDTRNALADMPAENAVVMDNFFPDTDRVILRRGFASHATGMSGSVETLMPYAAVDGTEELYAANGGNIYDVTSAGAVGAAKVSGMTNDRWQFVQIGTSGGNFLVAVNGADTPRTYDGSSWSTAGMTGPTIANLNWINTHQRRLWFGEDDSLSAWYLAVNSITGAATEFPLYGLASKGGKIMAMGTWTRDGGAGTDDVAVFITSEGQAILYQGTDPSSASTWSLVGVFNIGEPIGRRCLIKAGADMIVVTQDGFVSLSRVLSMDRSAVENVAISRQIQQSVNDAVRDYGSIFGWEPFFYPRARMLIFNIPQNNSIYHQYVFNTLTGAPCRFTGVNAVCWGMLSSEAYFGGTDGVVYKFDTGDDDNGVNIVGDCLQAFSYFGSPTRVKAFKKVEPVFQSNGNPNAAVDLNTDFQIAVFQGVTAQSPTNSGLWGVGKWGVALWGSADQIYRSWRGVRGIGRSAALRVRISTGSARPSWIATNFLYTEGGSL